MPATFVAGFFVLFLMKNDELKCEF